MNIAECARGCLQAGVGALLACGSRWVMGGWVEGWTNKQTQSRGHTLIGYKHEQRAAHARGTHAQHTHEPHASNKRAGQKRHRGSTLCGPPDFGVSWKFISTFTELHGHGDERWPTEVAPNTYFRWPTEVASTTYFRWPTEVASTTYFRWPTEVAPNTYFQRVTGQLTSELAEHLSSSCCSHTAVVR